MDEVAQDDVSRRGFLKASAGLTFSFTLAGLGMSKIEAATMDGNGFAPNAWLTIGTDDRITIMSPVAEMGQGCFTAIPLMLAEELDCDWSDVSLVQSSPDHRVFGNPGFGGILHTVASRSVNGYYDKVRMVGAQARRVLLDNAAGRWRVPVTELSTEPSIVLHRASGRRMKYGEIAAFARMPASPPALTAGDLKRPDQFRLIGKDIDRYELPDMVSGRTVYGLDVHLPGMLYGSVLRSPIDGKAPDRIDDGAARKIPGITDVIRMPWGVGVIGRDIWSVFRAIDSLQITWKNAVPADGYNSARELVSSYRADTLHPEKPGKTFTKTGDFGATIKTAATEISAEYFADYAHHMTMEPMTATAKVDADGKGAEIWIGTQAITRMIGVASNFLKTKPNRIRLNELIMGGGFGRRFDYHHMLDALFLSKASKQAVKVIWSREEDVRHGTYRPQTTQYLRAGLDKEGRIVAWNHRLELSTSLPRADPKRHAKAGGRDPLLTTGANHIYDVPNQLGEFLQAPGRMPLGPWRAIGGGYTKFAVESFIDEIAGRTSEDPLAMRLRLLSGHPRAQHVLRTVAEMAGWDRHLLSDHALGIAFSDEWKTLTAGVAEISLDRSSGVVTVHNFWVAVDPGRIIQPRNVEAQLEGAVIFGLSHVFKERISVDGGEVQQSNFHDYQVMRFADVPPIHVKLISTDHKPTGVGEVGLPVTGGAIANAIAKLTGKRVRHLPITPDRVLAALRS
ncbi:MAG: molybdopterin-dependent oxidoreductase [Proteobacteria bacterium]|nr:molybdopterin-dependent oxidoreductase [Pseudomonadota bacterium]